VLNDGDVVNNGQHEIMYFDERQVRTRSLGAEDDAAAPPQLGDPAATTMGVPALQEVGGPDPDPDVEVLPEHPDQAAG
jgi:hypothetical protein